MEEPDERSRLPVNINQHLLNVCVIVGDWRHSGCERVPSCYSAPEGGPGIWHQPQTPPRAQELQVRYAAHVNVAESMTQLAIFFKIIILIFSTAWSISVV